MLKEKIKSSYLTMIEMFDSEAASCLLKSIPIKDITDAINENVFYYKIDKDSDTAHYYQMNDFPTLLVFQNGNLLGRVDGYYTIEEKDVFKKHILEIISKRIL